MEMQRAPPITSPGTAVPLLLRASWIGATADAMVQITVDRDQPTTSPTNPTTTNVLILLFLLLLFVPSKSHSQLVTVVQEVNGSSSVKLRRGRSARQAETTASARIVTRRMTEEEACQGSTPAISVGRPPPTDRRIATPSQIIP